MDTRCVRLDYYNEKIIVRPCNKSSLRKAVPSFAHLCISTSKSSEHASGSPTILLQMLYPLVDYVQSQDQLSDY